MSKIEQRFPTEDAQQLAASIREFLASRPVNVPPAEWYKEGAETYARQSLYRVMFQNFPSSVRNDIAYIVTDAIKRELAEREKKVAEREENAKKNKEIDQKREDELRKQEHALEDLTHGKEAAIKLGEAQIALYKAEDEAHMVAYEQSFQQSCGSGMYRRRMMPPPPFGPWPFAGY